MKPARSETVLRLAMPALLLRGDPRPVRSRRAGRHPDLGLRVDPQQRAAGGHPDVEIYFEVENRVLQHSQSACNCEDVKDAIVHFPPGSSATPTRPRSARSPSSRPTNARSIRRSGSSTSSPPTASPFNSAVYNLIPPPDDAGLLGFKIFLFGVPQFTVLSSRTGSDYGLDAAATSIYHGLFPLQSFQQDIWGVPADPIHDPLRLNPEENPQGKGETAYTDNLCDAFGAESSIFDPSTIYKPCGQKLPPEPSHSPLTPFLQDPTNCDSAHSSRLEVVSYDGGVTTAEDSWPKMIGCDQLAFNPSLYAQPTTAEADSASGIEVNLEVPQDLSPTIPSPTELRGATP